MQCNRMKRSSPLQIFRFITSLPDVNAHIDQKGGKFSVAFSQTVDQTKEIGIPDPQKKLQEKQCLIHCSIRRVLYHGHSKRARATMLTDEQLSIKEDSRGLQATKQTDG